MRVAFLLCLLFVTGAVCEYWSGTKALLQTMAKEKHLQQHQLAKALQQLKPGEKNDKLPSPEELPQLLEEYQKDFLQIYNELDLIYPELAVMLDAPIHANGKEIDRAKMGVMLFLWTVVGDSGAFMSFKDADFLKFRTNVVTKLTNLARLVPDRHLDAQFKGKQHDPIVDFAGVAIDCRVVHVVALEIAINDLGKSKEFSKQVNIMLRENKVVKFAIIDHDMILRKALEWYNGNTKPASHLTESEKYLKNILDQTYGQVPRVFKEIMAKGLASDFNPAQFLQGECLPGNLAVLKQFLTGSDDASTATVMDVFLLHSLFDLLAGGGLKTVPGFQVNLWGFTLPGFLIADNWLPTFDKLIQTLPSTDPLKFYQDYAKGVLEGHFVEKDPEGQLLEPGLNARYTWSLQRVLLLTRANQCPTKPCEVATTVVKAFKKHISNEKSLLAEYLAETGYHGQRGFLLYYAPQLWVNIKDNINAEFMTMSQKVELYLHTLEQLYRKIDMKLQTARIRYTPPSKVISVNINAVAAAVGPEYKNAAFDASVLDTRHFEIRGSGNEYIMCNPKKATAGC